MAIKILDMAIGNMKNSILHFSTSTNSSAHFFDQESRIRYFEMHKKAFQTFIEVFEHPKTTKLTVAKANSNDQIVY